MKIINFFATAFFTMSLVFMSCGDDCGDTMWFEDKDGDGFGVTTMTMTGCDKPDGFVSQSGDINDNNAALNPNTVWTGTTTTFSKGPGADWTLAENQDRITDLIWLTRSQPGGGLFNIVTETEYTDFSSPAGTEWSFGTTADIETLTFLSLEDTHGSNMKNIVGLELVMHLIEDDIYMDVVFTEWSSGGGTGGGDGAFTYQRSTK